MYTSSAIKSLNSVNNYLKNTTKVIQFNLYSMPYVIEANYEMQ